MASREKSRTFHKEVVFDINRKFRTRFSKEMTTRKSKARKFETRKFENSKILLAFIIRIDSRLDVFIFGNFVEFFANDLQFELNFVGIFADVVLTIEILGNRFHGKNQARFSRPEQFFVNVDWFDGVSHSLVPFSIVEE